jgi:acid phosphatase type 7
MVRTASTERERIVPRHGLPAFLTALVLASTGCGVDSDAAAPTPPAESTSQATESSAAAATATPVTIMGAGDIAGDPENAIATAGLIRVADPSAVFTTGDNAYPAGSPSDYAQLYEPTWGFLKDRTHPVPGNHDYVTAEAAGYVGYFGAEKVTNPDDGGLYYAWDVGNGWRAYALNTEISTSGEQLTWLKNDVAAHPGQHYVLYTHHPRYTSSTEHGPSRDVCPLWDALAATGGLEIVLFGHNHQYERFAPMDCTERTSADGARSFVIGSGGKTLYEFGPAQPGSEFRNNTDFGVLKLALYENSYEWEFIASGRGQVGSDDVETTNAGQILDKGSAGV